MCELEVAAVKTELIIDRMSSPLRAIAATGTTTAIKLAIKPVVLPDSKDILNSSRSATLWQVRDKLCAI